MTPDTIVLELARIEAAHLAGLVGQFDELLEESSDTVDDPAVLRLVPDAYEDAEAAREFREITESDLLGRRRADAARVLANLAAIGDLDGDLEDPAFVEQVAIVLDREDLQAWLRTLAAVRLVLATDSASWTRTSTTTTTPSTASSIGSDTASTASSTRSTADQPDSNTSVARLRGASRAMCASSCRAHRSQCGR